MLLLCSFLMKGKRMTRKPQDLGKGLKNVQMIESRRDHGLKKYVGTLLPSLSLNTQHIELSCGEARKAFSFQTKPTSCGGSRKLHCSPDFSLVESLGEVWWGFTESICTAAMPGSSLQVQRTPKFCCFRDRTGTAEGIIQGNVGGH